jgi:hypothetical protein
LIKKLTVQLKLGDEVSGDPKDKQKSVYSTDAAYERRVELKVIEVK